MRQAINDEELNHEPASGINGPKIHRIRSSNDRIEPLISDHDVMRATLFELSSQSDFAGTSFRNPW
jgi:hypothetical protein